MTSVRFKILLSAALLGLAALAVSACGNDVPTGAVAKVGDETISQEEFDKWLATAAKGQSAQTGGPAAVPDPPNYTKCIAAKKKAPVPKGQDKPSDAQLKKQCETEYETLRTQVMQFLIQATWVQQEAEEQGIEVSDKEIRKSFEDQKKQAFPTEKAYKEFLKSSGMTEEDILFRVKLDQLQQKLTRKVSEGAAKVTDADIEEYYEKNKERFAQPERRDLSVILTKTEAKANQAKQELDQGVSFKKVVREYSIDEASKAQGGKLPAVSEGQQEKEFDEAIFSAQPDKIVGPVKTQFGWYVFKVDKVTKAKQQTLEEARDTIRNLLRSQGQQKALDKFIKEFREEYKEKTHCADDFRVAECSNAPKERKQGSGNGGGGGGAQQPPSPENPQP